MDESLLGELSGVCVLEEVKGKTQDFYTGVDVQEVQPKVESLC